MSTGSKVAFGANSEASSTGRCSAIKTPQDIINCALENHPEVRRARLGLSQSKELPSVAGQLPNPQVSGKSVYGKSLGDNIANTELNLSQPIWLGGKRSSRIERAEAEVESAEASLLRAQEDAFLDTLRALYRARQIQGELHVLEEALFTFSKIQRQMRSRPRLSPEQQVSFGVFELAENDYNLRRASLQTESNAVSRGLGLILGQAFTASENLLPPPKTNWPTLDGEKPFKGSAFKSAEAELKVAQAEVEVARADSWPDLQIGPTYERTTEGAISYSTIGVNLTLPLPLLNLNGGGRAFAHKGLTRAEQSFSIRGQELLNARAILLQQYNNAVSVLKRSASAAELERKHRNVEALFERGIIPSSLVIEAHRQLVDFTTNKNAQELSAIEALWRIYILEGRLFEEKL